MDWSWVFGVLLLGIMSMFLILLFLPKEAPPPTSVEIASLLDSCLSVTCEEGLVCDSLTMTCKKPDGNKCSSGWECLGTSYCSGVCTSRTNGGLFQPCPCNEGLVCTKFQCKKDVGVACSGDDECSTGQCDTVCVLRSNGQSCVSNVDCSSGHCSRRVCQPPGVTTGDIGSSCSNNSVCTGGNCTGGICVSLHGLGSSCGGGYICPSIMSCNNSVCTFGSDPNSNDVCIGGMAKSGNVCKNAIGIGCTNNNQCINGINGVCGSKPTMSTLVFSDTSGLTNMGILKISDSIFLTGLKKILVRSTSTTDTFYAWTDYGIITASYNGTFVSNWISVRSAAGFKDIAQNTTSFFVVMEDNTVHYGPSFADLVPFNVQPGIGPAGTQYDTTNVSLSIEYIDVAENNDVILTSGGRGMIKKATDAYYSQASAVGGPFDGTPISSSLPISFYYDTIEGPNLPGPTVCPPNGINQTLCPQSYNIMWVDGGLQFSGNVAGFSVPYPVTSYSLSFNPVSLRQANLISVVGTYNLALTRNGNTQLVPYQTSASTIVLASPNRFYVIDKGQCM